MATVYSNEVSVGTYNRIRIKCDYSGTSATLAIQFRRTSSYTTTWSDTGAELTFNGTTKAAAYSYTGTVGTSWVTIKSGISGYSVSTAGGTYNWNFTNPIGGVLACSGTLTVPSQSSTPTGLAVSITSQTWNSITGRASLSSWNGTGETLRLVINSDPDDLSHPRQEYQVATTGTSGTITGTNSNYTWRYDNSFPVKGCMTYYASAYAKNTDNYTAKVFDSTKRYTPPAPLQSFTVKNTTPSSTANQVTYTFGIVGGSSSNNYDANAITYYCYRYSTDGGSTWTNPYGSWPATAWTPVATGTPWTERTFSLSFPYSAQVQMLALQQFGGINSERKSLNFSTPSLAAPSGLAVSCISSTWDTVTLRGSITSYGTPSAMSTRKLAIGVSESQSGLSVKRENQITESTSGTTTVTNESIYPAATALTIKGCKTVWPYIWAYNGVWSNTLISDTSVVTPPAPLSAISYSIANDSMTVQMTASENNEEVTATWSLKIFLDDATTPLYTYNESHLTTSGATVSKNIPLTTFSEYGEYTIKGALTYNGQTSASVSTTYSNPAPQVRKLYCSVNGQTREVSHLYGPVNMTSKKITKLYGSVNGVTKLVFQDS